MYKVTFNDGSEVIGGEPENSKWDTLPQKPIKSILIELMGQKVLLSGFEAYTHVVEHVVGVNVALKKISRVLLMGLFKNRSYQVIYDFDKAKVEYLTTREGEELRGKRIGGWRVGEPDGENPPKVRYKDLG